MHLLFSRLWSKFNIFFQISRVVLHGLIRPLFIYNWTFVPLLQMSFTDKFDVSLLLWRRQQKGFSFNEFYWIQQIQWKITKSKSDMVTIGTTHLDTVTFSVIVTEKFFTTSRYVITLNRYLSTSSSRNFAFTTFSKNITFTRHKVFLVAIPLLNLVVIHWTQWIWGKSFIKNSNRFLFRN